MFASVISQRLDRELLSISSGRTGRNWSTSPKCIVDAGVFFDRRCDCDCHGLCGWKIGSLSDASALCPPPSLHNSPAIMLPWCAMTSCPSQRCWDMWQLLWHFRKKSKQWPTSSNLFWKLSQYVVGNIGSKSIHTLTHHGQDWSRNRHASEQAHFQVSEGAGFHWDQLV